MSIKHTVTIKGYSFNFLGSRRVIVKSQNTERDEKELILVANLLEEYQMEQKNFEEDFGISPLMKLLAGLLILLFLKNPNPSTV